MNLRLARRTGSALKRLLSAFVIAFALVLIGTTFGPVASAQAMTTEKATARPNEDGGSGVIGGIDTRLTWEGTVGSDEEVTSITLTLPDDANFDDSSTRITVLDGLNRISIEGTAEPAGNSIVVTFSEPIPANSLLRLEITGMRFPAAGGEYAVSGSYTTTSGQTISLEDSSPIEIMANTPLQSIVNWLNEQPWVAAWNSNQFLGMFLRPQLLVTSMVSLFGGWLVC